MNFNIKARRLELGLSQEQVAEYCNTTVPTVSRWESGEIGNMKRNYIKKLSEILCVSPLVLLDMEAGPKVSTGRQQIEAALAGATEEEMIQIARFIKAYRGGLK